RSKRDWSSDVCSSDLRFHPDADRTDPGAAGRFAEITAAYDILVDADRRRSYDLGVRRSAGLEPLASPPARPGTPPCAGPPPGHRSEERRVGNEGGRAG